MLRNIRGRLLAAALVLTAAPFALPTAAQAQVSFSISFDTFHDQLSPYGAWVFSDRWGTVWQPDVAADFRPYDTGGHWEYTSDYGWMWVSSYDWGDITFHYGRWVFDPDDGWMWMPGYVWSPAWVVWRGNNDYIGWMPMPPDDSFLSGRGDIGVSISWGDPDRYYRNWYGSSFSGSGSMWVFVNTGHIADRDYHRYAARRDRVPVLVRQTQNITNYTVVNNYVVNRSVDVRRVERVSGHQIRPVTARQVVKRPNLIATVSHGEQVRSQMLQTVPRGTGKANSAPAPSQTMVDKLSDRAPRTGGRQGASHIYTKSTIGQAGERFKGGTRFNTGSGNPAGNNSSQMNFSGANQAGPTGSNTSRMNSSGANPTGPTGSNTSRMNSSSSSQTGPAGNDLNAPDRTGPRTGTNRHLLNGTQGVPPAPTNQGPDAIPGRTPPPDTSDQGNRRGRLRQTPPVNTRETAPSTDQSDQGARTRMQHSAPPAIQPQNSPGPDRTNAQDLQRGLKMQHTTPNVQVPPERSASSSSQSSSAQSSIAPPAGDRRGTARGARPSDEPGNQPDGRRKKNDNQEAPPH